MKTPPKSLIHYGMHDAGYSRAPYDNLQQVKGAAFHGGNRETAWERCTVIGVDPETYSCTVYTESGSLLDGVPFPGEGRIPSNGSEDFAVFYGLGYPQLVETQHNVRPGAADTGSYTVTGVATDSGANSTVYAGKGQGAYRGAKPKDVQPGDWLKISEDGNLIGVLAGGVTLMKASELAQVIVTQAHNLVRMIGQNIRLDTGFGHLDLRTSEGKSTLELRLGADEQTEGSPDVENFRVRAEIGTEGEMVDFRVTDGQGRSVYRQYVDGDGRVQTLMEGYLCQNNGNEVCIVAGNVEKTVGGDISNSCEGAAAYRVGGAASCEVLGTAAVTTADDIVANAGRDVLIASRRNIQIKAGGQIGDTQPAVQVQAVNGDVFFDIGRLQDGDTQVKRSGFKVNTQTGAIEMSTRLGNIQLDTFLPNSVKLGGPGPGIFSAVLHEFFEQIIRVIGLYLDSHVHPIAALGGVPTNPPLIPSTPILTPLLPLSKSRFVKLGG